MIKTATKILLVANSQQFSDYWISFNSVAFQTLFDRISRTF